MPDDDVLGVGARRHDDQAVVGRAVDRGLDRWVRCTHGNDWRVVGAAQHVDGDAAHAGLVRIIVCQQQLMWASGEVDRHLRDGPINEDRTRTREVAHCKRRPVQGHGRSTGSEIDAKDLDREPTRTIAIGR